MRMMLANNTFVNPSRYCSDSTLIPFNICLVASFESIRSVTPLANSNLYLYVRNTVQTCVGKPKSKRHKQLKYTRYTSKKGEKLQIYQGKSTIQGQTDFECQHYADFFRKSNKIISSVCRRKSLMLHAFTKVYYKTPVKHSSNRVLQKRSHRQLDSTT